MARAQREFLRVEEYGYVRPVISAKWQGNRFVVVGSDLYYAPTWNTVLDFLTYYIKDVLGQEWGTAEITKPYEERHPILQWYDGFCRFQRRHLHTKSEAGVYSGERDGPTAAYVQLAYDLYVLGDHQKLQTELVGRLKRRASFQGARYELAVATHCIRAGFEIQHEDEADKTRKHPEFIATHRKTGQVIAVEAKSRHRKGVLGQAGAADEKPTAGVRRIVRQALKKSPKMPYAVFVDLNLPPEEVADVAEIAWVQEVMRETNKLPTTEDGKHSYNLIMFTNHPEHYGAEGGANPSPSRLSSISLVPRYSVEHRGALRALHDAALQHGRIPAFFDS